MPGWQIPGVPSVPTPVDMMRLMQLQVEVLTELPETLAELARAVRGLSETVEAIKDTVATAGRVADRLDVLMDDLESPVHGLRPGIERLSRVLDAPVIERLPAILESVESTVLPVAHRAERMRRQLERVGDLGRGVASKLRAGPDNPQTM
jgi:ABC-type transporter Mla subunit MlaD